MKTQFRALIVDDEVRSRSILHTMIDKHCNNITVSGEASGIDEALDLVEETAPDIVFLDIELGLGTGFDFLGQIPEIGFETIFVTAYDSFAIKAIKWSAMDYLLKPVDPQELLAAVDKTTKAISGKPEQHRMGQDATIMHNDKIGMPTMEGLKFTDTATIIRCEAKGAYTEIHFTGNRSLLVSKPLQVYEDILEQRGFMRIHKSHLVNLKYVSEYIKGRGGNVVMSDGAVIAVAVRKKDAFLKQILY